MTPGQPPPPDPRQDPPPTPGLTPPPDPRLDPPPNCPPPPPPPPPPPHRVLTDSWGVGRIRTGCSRPPVEKILRVSDLYDLHGRMKPSLTPFLGSTWKPVYEQALTTFNLVPATDWSIPSVWMEVWAKSDTLKRLVSHPQAETR